jgi:hypothetical protein
MSLQCITAAASATATDNLYDIFCGYGSHHTLLLDNMYATMPMSAVQPAYAYAQPDEEELHTSFEQAISDRVTAINGKLRRMASNPSTPACAAQAHIQARVGLMKRHLHSASRRQRRLLFGCLALMLLLTGFDLMGLLVLAMH